MGDAGAIVGLGGGVLLRYAGLSGQGLELLGLPGELMLRLLKMLVLPLIAGSMVAGVSPAALLRLFDREEVEVIQSLIG